MNVVFITLEASSNFSMQQQLFNLVLFDQTLHSNQMGRSKVTIKFIECQKSRYNTFLKRRKGLNKKAFEFATLCGVDVCMICFGPQGDQQHEPLIWPNDPKEIRRIIKRYEGLNKEEQDRRKLDLMGFLEERIRKLGEELDRKGEGRANMLYPSWDDRLNDLPEEVLRDLLAELDSKLVMVNEKIEFLKENLPGKEVSLDFAPQTYINHMQELAYPNQMQELSLYEKNAMMDVNLMAIQPIQPLQPVPISCVKPLDQIHMPMQLPYNPNVSTFPNFNTSNDNHMLPPVYGCYGDSELEILDNDFMLHSQRESCGDGCSCSFLQFQSSAMEPPPSSSLNSNLQPLQAEEAVFLHQTYHSHQGSSDIKELLIKMNRRRF